ncbi:MAG TPA: MBL fold metallo-hydrolase [Xanthobacteraceae bacterium]|jgi:glyoxylase-like metal-dependent hydrolase (beta-lactamase superfamily II)|nr:MBL fold metallo-hydrolase [Xanthobacteraceae bacterium]
MNRRAIMKGALGGIVGLTLPPLGRLAFSQEGPAVVPVSEGFVMVTGAGGNVLVRTASAGQVLVDGGAAEFTDAILGRLRELPGAGHMTTIFNTHWHREQVGGNLAFGRSEAKIIAHEKTRARLATDYYLHDEDRYEKALPAAAHPSVTFFSGDQALAGDERIEYGHLLEAHTDGDIYVFFRDANVLAAGDAISPLKDPVLDWFGGGWLGGRVDAQEKLLKLTNAETRIVPSYGPVVGRTELQAEFDMSRVLFDRMLDLLRKGMSAQDMLDAGLMQGLNRTLRDPFRFTYDAHKGYWAHHNSLGPDVL